eukprot:gene37643-50825_t
MRPAIAPSPGRLNGSRRPRQNRGGTELLRFRRRPLRPPASGRAKEGRSDRAAPGSGPASLPGPGRVRSSGRGIQSRPSPRRADRSGGLALLKTGDMVRIDLTKRTADILISGEELAQRRAALKAAGIRREERVLLLMLDGNDWPVSFLGCLYAGIVPVAVNTLLTPDDYAYMLDHSRAQAVLVSGALLPTLQEAMARGGHEVQAMFVSQPAGPLPDGAREFDAAIAAAEPLASPVNTTSDDPGFWLYSSGSTGKPKGTVHTHAN